MRARLYDWEVAEVLGRTDQDRAWWLDLARQHGPVLELACGTGRIAVPLARAGIDVVGLDIEPAMLAQARRRARDGAPGRDGSLRLVVADMRTFCLHHRFGAVIVPYNSIQLLSGDGEAELCLATAASHLSDDGVVGLEVTDFQDGATSAAVEPELLHRGSFEGASATVWGGLRHDLATRRSHYRRRIDLDPGGTVVDQAVTLRCFNRAELSAALGSAGLEPTAWWTSGPTCRVVARPT